MIRLRIKIRYRGRLLLPSLLLSFMILFVLMGALGLKRVEAKTSNRTILASAIVGVRHYYLSGDLFLGNQVSNACAPGYHMASIWEIADPSRLKYNTSHGLTSPDSGSGPPVAIELFGVADMIGWVRTGYNQSTNEPPGHANCNGWLSNNEFHWGTVAGLPSDWTAGGQDVGVWDVNVIICDTTLPVWCVQDDSLLFGYMPLILK